MAIVPWAQPFPTGWSESRNSGATWAAPNAAATTNQVVGPRGSQRFRTIFTIPSNVAGTYFVTVSGDTFDNSLNDPAELFYDGATQGVVSPLAGPRTYTLPVVPGEHTIELWIGASDDAGLTIPTVTFGFNNVVETGAVPCNCCPVDGPTRCAMTQVRFESAVQTAGEAGWNQTGLNQTADGITATAAITGYTTGGASFPSTTLRVTYTLDVPWDRVRGLRLWNQTGNDLGDADGLGQFDAEFYAGVILLATHTFTGVNGGAAQNLLIPALGELNGVDRVVLRSVHTQGDVNGVKPTWRELQLLTIREVYSCRMPDGTIRWYDPDGNLVPTADVTECSYSPQAITQPTPFTVPDLHLLGGAFADASGENLCSLTPAPVATSGWNAPSGGCYDPVSGTPTMDWASTTSLSFTYGGPGLSGGVFMHFSSPTLGSITWPVNMAQMTVGEQRWSNFFGGGRLARLTYISGSACSVQMPGGTQLNVHFGCGVVSVNNTFLLEFFQP